MSANKQFLSRLPFPPLVLSQPKDKAYYSEVTKQVEAIMVAKIRLAQAQTDKDKTYYENKCAALAHQIDQLVYELYGLRENEIKNVECETSDNK